MGPGVPQCVTGAGRAAALLGLLLALALTLAPPLRAAEMADITAGISADIEASQRELSRLEDDIGERRQTLAREINAAQNAVADLRQQAVAARRATDEQTLSLEQLEQRLQQWRQQSQFQNRLLASFHTLAGPAGEALPAQAEDGAQPGLRWLEQYLAQRRDLRPQWREGDIVMPDGEILTASHLRLGPVEWFWQPALNAGGLTDNDASLRRATLVFNGAARQGLANLFRDGQGQVTLDPTLSQALLLETEQESILQHVQKGGVWVVPILLFALFASAVASAKAVSLWRLPALMPALPARVEQLAREGESRLASLREELRGPQAQLLDISLRPMSAAQRDDRLFACLLEHKHRLERWLGAIAVTAAVAPLLGLLGTVSGMITTFKAMTLFGAGDPSVVSEGISEALVTTELGLIVAIPALLGHALMSRRVKSYFARLETDAIQLSQLDVDVDHGESADD